MCVNYFRILLMNLSFRRFPIFFQGYTLYLRLWACRAEAGPSRARLQPAGRAGVGRAQLNTGRACPVEKRARAGPKKWAREDL